MTNRKKLIEVALPLEKINVASAREKSIRHGHPSTLHLWWARRPLAAARAVIFAQMVDDPAGYVDELLSDPGRLIHAQRDLLDRHAAWEQRKRAHEDGDSGAADPGPAPTLDECAAEIERQRLFRLIEQLVLWENTTNEPLLQQARDEIWKSWRRTCASPSEVSCGWFHEWLPIACPASRMRASAAPSAAARTPTTKNVASTPRRSSVARMASV